MEPPSSAPPATAAPTPSAFSAAAEVLASDVLFPAVCAFLPGLPTWLVDLQRTHGPAIRALERTLAARKTSGTPGLLPYLALQQRDQRTLRRLWLLHKQPQFRKNPRLWFHSTMNDAAAIGNLSAIEWLHDTAEERCGPLTLTIAATHGHADVVRWLLQGILTLDGDDDDELVVRAMVQAAAHGRLEVLRVFYEVKQIPSKGADPHATMTDAVDAAAKNGHEQVVRWLVAERGERFTSIAFRGAVANGHLALVEFLWDHHQATSSKDTTQMIEGMRAGVVYAIRNADFAMLRFLHDRVGDAAFPRYTLPLAMQLCDGLEVFRFLHDMGRPQHDLDHALGASTQRVERMQLLLEPNTFSLEVLNKVLRLAESVQDPTKTHATAEMLRAAIAKKKEEAKEHEEEERQVGQVEQTEQKEPESATTAKADVSPDCVVVVKKSVGLDTTIAADLFVPARLPPTNSRSKAKTRRPATRRAPPARGKQAFLASPPTIAAST